MAKTNDEVERHRAKALPGKSTTRGVDFEPERVRLAAKAMALAEGVEIKRLRPARTRFPIDYETYFALKEEAVNKKLSQKKSTLVQDKAGKKPEVASSAAVAPKAAMPALAPAAAPIPITNFAGIAATGWTPFDGTIATGPQHVFVSVNSSISIYNKIGGVPLLERTLDDWFANVVSDAQIFDPKALFDQHEGRWILAAAAFPRDESEKKSWLLLSVSRTGDPLGRWWNYALDATRDGTRPTNNWADYPCLGVDNQALYLTANMFEFDGGFQYSKIRIIPKAGPYSGGAVTFKDIVKLRDADGLMSFTVQPCHTFGAPQVEYMVNSLFPTGGSTTRNQLSLWSLTDPLNAPTLTRRTITTDPYGLPPHSNQKGGGMRLDSGDVRLLNAVFRGGSVWTSLTTRRDWGEGINRAAAHWFQINATSGVLVQQGIYGARRLHYFYPVVMPDSNGNMTMAFCRCGASEFPSIFYSGRRSTDPLGQLQASARLKAGVANYGASGTNGVTRWGDYNGISIDAADGRVVWFYSGFASTGNQWGTWVGSSRF